ncbi:MAG: VCBS repeat-containing protein [Candidatus Eisenbacteria bacterium]|nr:VCBS repeat-containing protein [Candidatus Eisenbacteria bacterium]
MNLDGRPDLLLAAIGSHAVSVLLGTGSGGFGTKTDIPTGTQPYSVAIGDVNGDGKLDLATANYAPDSATVMLGDGLGGFGSRRDFGAGGGPWGVTLGDLNGDRRLDLALANWGSGTVGVLLGDGTGGFGTRRNFTTGPQSTGLAIGDLNGDGRSDLAVSNAGTNAVSVLIGLTPTRTALTVSPNPVVLGMPVTLTASISIPAPGSGAPADSVRFFDGTTLLGISPVNGGAAGLALFAPRLGNRAITAVYKGDSKLFGSYSGIATQQVAATAAAAITSIADVKNDQGGTVRLVFGRSPFDYLGSGIPITGYQVYRREIVAGAAPAMSVGLGGITAPNATQLAGWDFVTTVPATTEDTYQATVPTFADSNSSGLHRAVLFVRAASATPGVFHDSPADSGYSVDNLPPVPPAPFTAAYISGATHLNWGANTESDLWHYRVYRGSTAGFTPAPGNLIAATSDAAYVDAGAAGSYYKLAAVDVNGNESGYASLGPNSTLGVSGERALSFSLEALQNPARGGRLLVAFTLPLAGSAKLELVDVGGRRVALREVGVLGAGRHELALGEGQRLASGMYFVRLTQGARVATKRVAMLD